MNSDYVYENENPPTLIVNKDNDDRTEHNKEYYEKYIKDQILSKSNRYYLDINKLARLEKELETLKLQLKMKQIEIEKQKKFENDLKQIQMEREHI